MTITATDLILGALLAVTVMALYQTIVDRFQQQGEVKGGSAGGLSQQVRDLLRPQTSIDVMRPIQRHTHTGHDVNAQRHSGSQSWERAAPNHPAEQQSLDLDQEAPNAMLIAEEIRRLVQSGQMVKALQYYRQQTGGSLKDAKKAVQRIVVSGR